MTTKSKLKIWIETKNMDKEYLRAAFRWSIIIRTLGFFIFGLAITLFWIFNLLEFNPRPVMFFLLPAAFLSSIICLFLGLYTSVRFSYLNGLILFDIALVTVIIHYSGGQESYFPFLYLIPVISATLFSIQTTAWTGLLALTTFLMLIYFEPPTGILFPTLVRVTRLVLIITIVAFQTYYFISRIKKRDDNLSKLKDHFLLKTIHSLRSSARSLRGIIERLSIPEFVINNPDTQKEVKDLQKTNEQMTTLINDLLFIVKSEEANIVIKRGRVFLPRVLRKQLHDLNDYAKSKEITFTYSPQHDIPLVWADSARLSEVFGNLIDNAIKYNKKEGSIIITHEVLDRFVITSISDSGIGMSEEKISQLFTPSFDEDMTDEMPSTGLGLFIAKKLLEKMNGKIEASSAEGEGSTFRIFLPIVS